jgi:hypothetical protein
MEALDAARGFGEKKAGPGGSPGGEVHVSRLIQLLVGAALAFGVTLLLASEFGGEVVKLTTTDEVGAQYTTSLWIVDDGRTLWLRAGSPNATWFRRLPSRPDVELERAGRLTKYRAVAVKEATPGINSLMAEKYGWADWLIALVVNHDDSVAVRLDPGR